MSCSDCSHRIDKRDPKARYEVRRGPDPVNALLCSHVHLAPLRFGPDATWPGGKTFANHAKLWMVDDRVFYVGSDNFYPVNLQEFGYIVDDQKAAAELLDAYWNSAVAMVANAPPSRVTMSSPASFARRESKLFVSE